MTANPSAIAERLVDQPRRRRRAPRATGSDRAPRPAISRPRDAGRQRLEARRVEPLLTVWSGHRTSLRGQAGREATPARGPRETPSAGGQPAGAPPGPAGDAGGERGDARRAPVPRRLCAQPRTTSGPVLVPERAVPVATRGGAQRRQRRPRGRAVLLSGRDRRRRDPRGPSRSRRRRCRARRGPARTASAGVSRHAPPAVPACLSQTAARRATSRYRASPVARAA